MFAILGEALIDMVIQDNGKTLQAHFGGGPFNTALALARLEQKTYFHSPLSTDYYGCRFHQFFKENNIIYSCPYRSDNSTPLAIVHLDNIGNAEYRFYRHHTAERDLRQTELLSSLPKELFAIHTGSLAISEEPDSSIISHILQEAKKKDIIISIDPNIREKSFHDKKTYRKVVKKAMQMADILKLSDDDLSFLYPNAPANDSLHRLYEDNKQAALIVLTSGNNPIKVKTSHEYFEWSINANKVNGDTIGAGDCFIAGLLYQCKNSNLSGRESIKNLTTNVLHKIIDSAAQVARFNCQHFGCNPPSKKDIETD